MRDLHRAMERNITAVEALTTEMRELRGWIESTSASTKEIAESRIWRSLTSLAGLLAPSFKAGKPAPARLPERDPDAEYQRWIEDFEGAGQSGGGELHLEFHPLVSVVAAELPTRTIESILEQSYDNWEVCLAGGAEPGSGEARVRRVDSGGEESWEKLLLAAKGEYVAVVEPGAVLSSDALLHAVESLQQQPRPDIVYTDEDVMDATGRRSRVFFKPDWSPDLLLSMNYIGGLYFFRRQLAIDARDHCAAIAIGSMYELLLELAARAVRIEHVARVLCHRAPAGSAPNREAERRAVDAHLRRSCPGAITEAEPADGRWRARYPAPADGRVSIIIASGGKADLLEASLQDLAERTEYREMEIVVVDNSSGGAVERLAREGRFGTRRVRYLDWRQKAFNFATICNAGADLSDSPFLLFLNDDVRALTPGWLQAMVELGARSEVGAVGARLLFPDGSIQHAGIALGLYGRSGHVFKGLDGREEHYFGLDRAIRNVSAVTGACLLVRREVFREVGGFDEERYPVDFNDIDLCLRIRAAGYRVLYTPYAELCHQESSSKQFVHRLPSETELAHFRGTWSGAIANDPFYNPNLTRAGIDYSPRKKGE